MDPISLNKRKADTVNENSKSCKKYIKLDKSDTTSSSGSKNGFRKKKRFDRKERGVIYLNHIPHGFYEDQMRSYFNQFGKVRATSVARSRKTGRSKGYGFVEFDNEEVAKIAAEAMNNYFMYNKVLKCRYISPQERKSKIFPRKFITGYYPRKKNRINNLKNKRKAFSNYNQSTYLQKTVKKINEFKKFFDERGIDFSFKFSSASQDTNSNSESTDDTNDQHGVLEIDESDKEISFKTPPKVKKIIKKSFNSPLEPLKNISHDTAQMEKKTKSKTLINSNSKSTQKLKEVKKKNEKIDADCQRINQKNKCQSKKFKGKEKLVTKSTRKKKLGASKIDNSAALKQKNAKIFKTNKIELAKKGENAKQSDSSQKKKTKNLNSN